MRLWLAITCDAYRRRQRQLVSYDHGPLHRGQRIVIFLITKLLSSPRDGKGEACCRSHRCSMAENLCHTMVRGMLFNATSLAEHQGSLFDINTRALAHGLFPVTTIPNTEKAIPVTKTLHQLQFSRVRLTSGCQQRAHANSALFLFNAPNVSFIKCALSFAASSSLPDLMKSLFHGLHGLLQLTHVVRAQALLEMQARDVKSRPVLR